MRAYPAFLSGDRMNNQRTIAIRFYKLHFSDKVAISNKLGLTRKQHLDLSDLDRFKEVVKLAVETCLLYELLKEIEVYENCT